LEDLKISLLYMSKQQKNITTMTNNTLQATVDAIRANIEAINAIRATAQDMPMAEAAQILLIERYNLSQAEAQEIVEQLSGGLADYNTQRAAAENSEDFIKSRIIAATESLSPEDRTTALSRLLTALELTNNKETSQEEIDSLVRANAMLSDEDLINAIAEAYQGLNLEAIIGQVTNESLDTEMVQKIADTAALNDAEYRLAAALQLYIAQREGRFTISGEDAPQIDPTTLGAMAGAGIDAYIASIDLHEGRITLEKWQRIMKWILGGLFAVAMFLFVTVALAYSVGTLALAIFYALGTGFVIYLLTMIATVLLISWISPRLVDAQAWILEKLSPIYDKVIVKLTEWFHIIKAKVAQWFEASKNWVAEKTAATTPAQTRPATVATPTTNNETPNSNIALA